MKFFRDLFMGVGNQVWELARFMSAWAITSFSFAFLYALIWKGQVPDWSDLGTGFGAVLLGAGALIGIKDIARAKALPVETALAPSEEAMPKP